MPPVDSHSTRPRILVFSEGCISSNHGTGAIFLRNFSAYPKTHLCNAFIGSGDSPGIASNINLNKSRWPVTFLDHAAALPARFWNVFSKRRPRALPASKHRIEKALRDMPFEPDLVYAICYGAEGLAVLAAIMKSRPHSLPLLLHFHDFWPSTNASFLPLLRRLGPRAKAIWAVSSPIARVVTATTGHSCLIDPGFHIDIPTIYKKTHRPFSDGFRVVLLGNIWNPALLQDLKAIWRYCKAKKANLTPIRWHCHPDGIAKLSSSGFEPAPELQVMDFLTGDKLWAMLAEADIAIIPFARHHTPLNDYESFSMPSRITELAAAGLPIFALTGQATSLAEYLDEQCIGLHSPASHTSETGDKLLSLIDNVEQRKTLGKRARAIAAAGFPLTAFQSELYLRLAGMAERKETN